jgi:cytochrome c553
MMKVVAHGLSKEDMEDVAKYLQGMTDSGSP